ncbi:MAG: hypothetical protein EGR51_00100 [Oscillibacter sp.]|nr:hypothetical protein [Oscillibacter sp.]
MSGQTMLRVTMELLSDTIFGSGFSIPGGEDIAVCRDAAGYPYLKGSTLKGLLRESLENYLVWTGGDEADLNALLGESGWSGADDGRRIHLTELTLDQRPDDPEQCFSSRMFTSLENGIVKEGTLRAATCIHSGQVFTGELTCRSEDISLVQHALAGIKWAGTMRSRGFSRVHVYGIAAETKAEKRRMPAARCIHYRLRTESPVLITDLDRSRENRYETRNYIPGSAIRGMVISALAAQEPEWFQAHRVDLLSDETRFLNAVPAPEGTVPLPSIKGFYEDKEETRFETVVKDGAFSPGLKRAKLGSFCALEGDTVRFWSTVSDGATRIGRKVNRCEEKTMFQTRGIGAGQNFEGYILLDDPELAAVISSALTDTIWLGADRYDGFGKCSVTTLETAEEPAWIKAYGCGAQEQVGKRLYLLAVSPFTMLDWTGEPCGLDLNALADKLGVSGVKILHCSTSLAEYGGYNRTWKCREPAVRMYDQGSIFQIECGEAPALEKLRALERKGIGIRRAEGFGQILFLRTDFFEGLTQKRTSKAEERLEESGAVIARRARYQWVIENAGTLTTGKLSRSQIGSIQSLCEKAIANGGDLAELDRYLEKNLTGRGVRHGARFQKAGTLIQEVLDMPLGQTLGLEDTAIEDSNVERLKLLCLLFDYSRRGKERVSEQ